MTKEQQAIVEFMLRAGQQCPVKPQLADSGTARLRLNLINEEALELRAAMMKGDLVEIADAIGDLSYVILGAAVAYGIDLEPVFWAIHESNRTKFIDGCRREDGKWIKGPSYTPVNLAPIIEAQVKH